jgi:recombination protein RecT
MTTEAVVPPSSALAERPKSDLEQAKPIDAVRATLEKLKPQMALALPRHLTPDRLARVAMTAIQNTPKLLDCDRTSLFAAIMTCAQLGLEPDGVLGQAYLVPFAGKVQFIPGYKGLITLARNSGEVVSIAAHEVCEKDHFVYNFGLAEKLEHVPESGERGAITHFYAYAKFKDGGHYFDVMTKAEVDAIRDQSSGYKSALKYKSDSPWIQNYVEMGKKTAIRRISKYLPMNVQKAAAIADMYDSGRHAELGDAGELVIEAQPVGGRAPASTEVDAPTNGLDKFAEGEPKDVTPTREGPPLFPPEKVEHLRSLGQQRGVDADAIASELSGSDLAGTPASFETEILRRIYAAPNPSDAGGQKSIGKGSGRR